MKLFKYSLFAIIILTGIYMICDFLFGLEQSYPQSLWIRLPKLLFFVSVFIYVISFSKNRNN
ncbi:hypothetical protein [Sporolactobacillus laevolacticus]|uniref:Uncharacterized protein n=1 Tax=Sporolactobacillus laevolacticus DSM 442 TaxID=1395513 RepID=V6IZK8_9BACL|nr:hypothetical protein [Sporolactobacillus laevolacticus]EST12261.1 hypothetical protein P343_08635 [Sporolactobacillus laevolacticus DSM 442]